MPKNRTYERYGQAFLAADRLSVPFKPHSPALGKPATAATVKAAGGRWAVVPVKPGTAKAQRLAEAAEARRTLRTMLKPGAAVHTILRHRSRSGMARHISLHIAAKGGDLRDITRLAALAMDDRLTKDGGSAIVVSGCGMDMGFHLVYVLSSRLYPDGHRCTGKKCPSNDHSNGDRDLSGKTRHSDGGYALRQRWL